MKNNQDNKSNFYAASFVRNIENGTIKRKCLPNHGEKYSGAREELSLYRYKRYLGSLRCVLDVENMRGYRRYEY